MFTVEGLEEEKPEQRKYYCVSRKSRLNHHKYLDIWICSECFAQYDTNIQDVPLKDISRPKVMTYPELTFNPTYDELDVHMTFVEGIDLDREIDGEDVEVVRSTPDRRVQHI
jgi:hypothetical protein